MFAVRANFRRIRPLTLGLALAAVAWLASAGSLRAAEPIPVTAGQIINVPIGQMNVLSTCGPGPHAGPTYSTFQVGPDPGLATVLGGLTPDRVPAAGATAQVQIAPDITYRGVISFTWGAVADGCYSANGGMFVQWNGSPAPGGVVVGGSGPHRAVAPDPTAV
jgi:hypothetical protein